MMNKRTMTLQEMLTQLSTEMEQNGGDFDTAVNVIMEKTTHLGRNEDGHIALFRPSLDQLEEAIDDLENKLANAKFGLACTREEVGELGTKLVTAREDVADFERDVAEYEAALRIQKETLKSYEADEEYAVSRPVVAGEVLA